MNMSGENDGCLYFRRSLIRRRRNKTPSLVILAGKRGTSGSDCNKGYYL